MYRLLLIAESGDKADCMVTADSLVSSLHSYYLEEGNDEDLHPRVNYILGRIYLLRNDYPNALEYFRESLRNLNPDENPDLHACLHSQIWYIFSRNQLYVPALMHAKKQRYYCGLLKDTTDIIKSNLVVARAYSYLKDHGAANHIYDSIAPLVKKLNDQSLTTQFVTQLASTLIALGEYDRADSLVNSTVIVTDGATASSVESLINKLNLHYGRTENLEQTSLNLITSSHDIYAQKTSARNLARINLNRGDTEKALYYTDLYHNLSDSITGIEAPSTVAQLEKIYAESTLEMKNQSLKERSRNLERIVSLAGFAVLLLGWMIYWNKEKMKRESIERELEFNTERDMMQLELDDSKEMLEKVNSELEMKSKRLEDLKGEIVESRRVLEQSLQENKEKENSLKEIEKELDVKIHEIEKRDRDLDNLSLLHGKMEEDYEAMKKEKDNIIKVLSELRDESEKRKTELNETIDKLAKVSAMVEEVKRDRDQKKETLRRIYKGLNEVEFRMRFVNSNRHGVSEAALVELEHFVNDLDHDFIMKIRKLNLAKRDYHDALFIRINMTSGESGLLTGRGGSAVRTSRSRLFKKTKDKRNQERWEDYILSFSNQPSRTKDQ